MAKKLASVKPVKCYGVLDSERVLIGSWPRKGREDEIPCVLMTQARYRYLMAVVRAAVADHEAGEAVDASPKSADAWKAYQRRIADLRAAIEAAEKAGVL